MPSVKNSKLPKLKAVDFFCGAGGVTCGFRQAGIEVIAGIDIDKTCRDTYEKNNKGAKFIEADISNLTFTDLQSQLSLKVNDDHLVFVGCSPCQYYTNLKTDKTKSEKSRLLLDDFREFISYFLPGFVFIENVPGLEKDKNSPLSKFKLFLEEKGYSYDDKVINTKYFGVPQSRRRYILIASRVHNKSITIPKEDKKNIKTVKDAIGDKISFPVIQAGYSDETDYLHTSANLESINLQRIKETPKDGGDRRVWQHNDNLQLECYKQHNGHTDVYGRMFWNKPAPTITTKFRYISNGRFGHPDQDRAISLREGATLQSFPLDYKFHSCSLGTIARMIGNAVPPALAYKIAEQFLLVSKS